MSEELRSRLVDMQARNQRNGALVLAMLLLVIVWVFTLPPDIRRGDLYDQVLTHYRTCGSAAASNAVRAPDACSIRCAESTPDPLPPRARDVRVSFRRANRKTRSVRPICGAESPIGSVSGFSRL